MGSGCAKKPSAGLILAAPSSMKYAATASTVRQARAAAATR